MQAYVIVLISNLYALHRIYSQLNEKQMGDEHTNLIRLDIYNLFERREKVLQIFGSDTGSRVPYALLQLVS